MCLLCLDPYLDLYRTCIHVDLNIIHTSLYIYIYFKLERCICMLPDRERERDRGSHLWYVTGICQVPYTKLQRTDPMKCSLLGLYAPSKWIGVIFWRFESWDACLVGTSFWVVSRAFIDWPKPVGRIPNFSVGMPSPFAVNKIPKVLQLKSSCHPYAANPPIPRSLSLPTSSLALQQRSSKLWHSRSKSSMAWKETAGWLHPGGFSIEDLSYIT